MAETSNIKNISQNVSQCRDGKPWKMTQTRMGWHTLHTHWQTRIGWHTLHTLPSRVCVCVCEAYVILFLFASVCEVYVIPFLFGSFFTVCHPYIDLHFVKCFYVTCKLLKPCLQVAKAGKYAEFYWKAALIIDIPGAWLSADFLFSL